MRSPTWYMIATLSLLRDDVHCFPRVVLLVVRKDSWRVLRDQHDVARSDLQQLEVCGQDVRWDVLDLLGRVVRVVTRVRELRDEVDVRVRVDEQQLSHADGNGPVAHCDNRCNRSAAS